MANNFFNVLKNLTETKVSFKDLSQEELKDVNPYLLNRYLSMNKDYIDIVNYCQFIPQDKKEQYYKIYLGLIPQKKVWLNYIKSKVKQPDKNLLKILANYFECSTREIKDYLKIISIEKQQEILYQLGYETDEIKKLYK